MNLDATDMELGHPVETWKAGEIIQRRRRTSRCARTGTRRPRRCTSGSSTSAATTSAIAWRRAGRTRSIDAVIAQATLDVDLVEGAAAAGHGLRPARGRRDHDRRRRRPMPGWASAVTSPEFATAEGSPEPSARRRAKMTWDEQNLYVFVPVTDTDIVSQYKQARRSAVEGTTRSRSSSTPTATAAATSSSRSTRTTRRSTRGSPATARRRPATRAWDSGMVTAVKLRGTPAARRHRSGMGRRDRDPVGGGQGPRRRDERPAAAAGRRSLAAERRARRTRDGGSTRPQAAVELEPDHVADFHALDRMLTVVFADQTRVDRAEAAGSPTDRLADAGTGTRIAATAGSNAVPQPANVEPIHRPLIRAMQGSGGCRTPRPAVIRSVS